MKIRALDPGARAEVELVAARMRKTLVEVLGARKGGSRYTTGWLVRRVLFHLDPEKSVAQVYLAEDGSGRIVGHTIVRVERDPEAGKYGLFSTTYVEPRARRRKVASKLLRRGEAWMRAKGLNAAATYTGEANVKLIRLYEKHGYRLIETFKKKKMVKMWKPLPLSRPRR